MEQKDMYTLRELFEELGISIAELGRRSGISEVTVAKIRDGNSARRSTVVNLLRTLSDIHGIKLSLANVSGIIINDKLARSESYATEKAEKPSVRTPVVRIPSASAEKAEKRVYNRKQTDTGLPVGSILASKFAENHGIARPTFYGHMDTGLGPGLIGMSTDVVPQKDHVDYSERPKPSRPKEKERYLTEQQQHSALEFWDRHNVDYSQCNDIACWCHTLKQENN